MEYKTPEEILIANVGKLALSGLKWKSLDDRKKLIIKAMDDYAAQELQRYKESQWISVKERLPNDKPVDSVEVIALCSLSRYVLDYITDASGNGKFYLSINYPTRIFHDFTYWVTHWMPITPPPPNT